MKMSSVKHQVEVEQVHSMYFILCTYIFSVYFFFNLQTVNNPVRDKNRTNQSMDVEMGKVTRKNIHT